MTFPEKEKRAMFRKFGKRKGLDCVKENSQKNGIILPNEKKKKIAEKAEKRH